VRVANKDFVTAESLAVMIRAATIQVSPPCPVDDCQPDSISAEPAATDPACGSLSTERKKLALAQAQMTVQALKQRSKPISPGATDPRVVPIGPTNSSSRR